MHALREVCSFFVCVYLYIYIYIYIFQESGLDGLTRPVKSIFKEWISSVNTCEVPERAHQEVTFSSKVCVDSLSEESQEYSV